MKKFWTATLLMMMGVVFTLAPKNAEAHRGFHKKRKGRCGRMLMRAPLWKLKKKVGLTDAQVTKLKKIKFATKKKLIPLRASIALNRVSLKELLMEKTVDKKKVLALVTRIHTIKGKAKLLRVSAKLQVRDVLTPEQRLKLKTLCFKMKRFRRMRRYRRWKRFKKMRGFHGGGHFRGYR
jgi:Spy/CpxP family protein refolding chaperone